MSAPSFTFSSSDPSRRKAIFRGWTIALLALIAVFFGSVELLTRFGFVRISRIASRIQAEYVAARSIGQDGRHQNTVLLVGNSLLGAAVNMGDLKRGMPPGWALRRFQIEDTTYYDWYFGLRRLFAEGSRPQVVAVMLSPAQTVATSVRGEFFARHMMRLNDSLAVAHDLSLHPTNTSGMIVGRLSEFYGARVEIRNGLLLEMLPDFQGVASLLTRHPMRPLRDEDMRPAPERIKAMRDLAAQYHARLVWVLPSLLQAADGASGMLSAANAAGIPILTPIPSGSLPASDYTDGFHLAPSGAGKFTVRLIPLFREYLGNLQTLQANKYQKSF